MEQQKTNEAINFIPAGHRVLVKIDPVETTSAGGIVIPVNEKQARHAISTGVIIAIGKTAWKAYTLVREDGSKVNGEPWAEVGQRISFSPNAGWFLDNEKGFKVLNDEDVIAIKIGE